jgi:hypothetical protein
MIDDNAPETYGILFTEKDLQEQIKKPRFLAAVHAYSMDVFPLGDAQFRAVEKRPYTPRGLEIAGYLQLIHEVAERIADGKLAVPDELRVQYPDIYGNVGPAGDEAAQMLRPLVQAGASVMKFSQLREPQTKKLALNLFRTQINEADIEETIQDPRTLAAIDAYRTSKLSLNRLKTILYGDFNAHPRDLSFFAFQRLCFTIIERIESGQIDVPKDLRSRFPEFYNPPDAETDKALKGRARALHRPTASGSQ